MIATSLDHPLRWQNLPPRRTLVYRSLLSCTDSLRSQKQTKTLSEERRKPPVELNPGVNRGITSHRCKCGKLAEIAVIS